MKSSEIKDEKALDVLADLIDPASDIIQDEDFRKEFLEGDKKKAVKLILKNHKKSIIEILAILDGKSIDEYEVKILTLPAKILEILNDPDLVQLF